MADQYTRDFAALLQARWEQGFYVCVGLDTDPSKIPSTIQADDVGRRMIVFNIAIIKGTYPFAAAFKLNRGFYAAHGAEGNWALKATINYLRAHYQGIPIILDGKGGDIGNSTKMYTIEAYEIFGADAVTVNPFMGSDGLRPFLQYPHKGTFVLCHTSNPGAHEFQDLIIAGRSGQTLSHYIASQVQEEWRLQAEGMVGLVVGANEPDILREIRRLAPDLPILIPGIGAQQGALEDSVRAAQNMFILNASRSIIFAGSGDNFAELAGAEAQRLHEQIRAAMS